MRALPRAIALAALALPAAAQIRPQLENLGWMATLAGGCWRGEHPDGKTRDTQCYTTQFGKYLRGTIRIEGAGPALEGDSVFAWDRKLGRIAYTQWASSGDVSSGEAYYEGDMLRFPDRPRPDTGQVAGRFSWKKIDDDTFRVARERRDGEDWKEAFAVVYRRVR